MSTERRFETLFLGINAASLLLGFVLAWTGSRIQSTDPLASENFFKGLLPASMAILLWTAMYLFLRWRGFHGEQIIFPVSMMIFTIGLVMIYRLRGADGAWQQVTRGLLPGLLISAGIFIWPRSLDWIRRHAAILSGAGLLLAAATAVFGVQDETGARLSLQIGPLPSIQTSEWIKLSLLIFLAWWIDREGELVEGRSHIFFGRFLLPAFRYSVPGLLFVGMATLILVAMSDYGAVIILAALFAGMLYAGFNTRLLAPTAAIAVFLGIVVGVILAFTWKAPVSVQMRLLAYQDPWSDAEVIINGQDLGVTVSEGPGYQIQQSLYAIAAGGLTGTGLGYGHPDFIPLAFSDFIFAALVEELGAFVALAVLTLYGILLMRILRISLLLPRDQIFERLLLVGISIHIFSQVIVMVAGTLNIIPLTGMTIPFLSQGGSALMENVVEIGLVLTLARRLEVGLP